MCFAQKFVNSTAYAAWITAWFIYSVYVAEIAIKIDLIKIDSIMKIRLLKAKFWKAVIKVKNPLTYFLLDKVIDPNKQS